MIIPTHLTNVEEDLTDTGGDESFLPDENGSPLSAIFMAMEESVLTEAPNEQQV